MSLLNSIFNKQPNARFETLETNVDIISNCAEYLHIILIDDELDFRTDGQTLRTIPKSNIKTIEILKGNSIERLTERSIFVGTFLGIIISIVIGWNSDGMILFPIFIATSTLLGAIIHLKPRKKIIGIEQMLRITWEENQEDFFLLLHFTFDEYETVKSSLSAFFDVEDEYYQLP